MKFITKSVKMAVLAFFIFAFSFSPVFAVDTPNFPACSNPSGTLKASYTSGTHGIVGDSGTYTGSDTVYLIGDGLYTQCFCSEDGSGIQTNWWNTSSLEQGQISSLEANGWIFVPTGIVWGLEDHSFLANNSEYSCSPSEKDACTNIEGIQTSIPDGWFQISEGSTECRQFQYGGPPESSNPEPQILGLASTGTTQQMLLFAIVGLILIVAGFTSQRPKKRNAK